MTYHVARPGIASHSTTEAISSGLPARPMGTFFAISEHACSSPLAPSRAILRVDQARIDRVHADAVLDVFQSGRPRQAHHAVLGM